MNPVRCLATFQLLAKLQNRVLQLGEGVSTKCSEEVLSNVCRSQTDHKMENAISEFVADGSKRKEVVVGRKDLVWTACLLLS